MDALMSFLLQMTAKMAASWVVCILVAIGGGIALWKMATNHIDLRYVISENDGAASMSRFQLLIFTFMVSMCLFIVVVGREPPGFPTEIPGGLLALLGISTSGFLVSKGINASAAANRPAVVVSPSVVNMNPGQTQRFSAETIALATPNVTWSLEPAGVGSIDKDSGIYTAPAQAASKAVVVRATSIDDPAATGIAVAYV